MRILHVIGNLAPEAGGPTTACLALARSQADAGHQVRIMAANWTHSSAREGAARHEAFEPEVGLVIDQYPVCLARRWLYSPAMRRALPAAVRDSDVVHIHGLYLYPCVAAGRVARRLAKPYLLRPLGTLDPVIQGTRRWRKAAAQLLFNRRLMSGAAALHFTSKAEQSLASDYVGRQQGFVVPLGVTPPPVGKPLLLLERWPALGGKPVLLFLGRLHRKKGLELLLEAFAALAGQFPDWQFLIVGGDDGMAAALRQTVTRCGLEQRVFLAGHLDGDARAAAFALASVFALTSFSENFGLAAVEAAASGLPLLLSDRVAIAGELARAGAALVVPCELPAITAALQQLMSSESLRQAMAQAGPSAARRFSWQATSQQLETLYRQLVERALP